MSVEITQEELTSSKEALFNSLKEAGVDTSIIDAAKDVLSKTNDFAYNGGVGRAYGEIDSAIKDVFSTEKDKGEQATSYLRRAAKLNEEGLRMDVKKGFEGIEKENQTLKSQLKDVPDASKYTDLQQTYNKALDDHKIEIENVKKGFESELKGYKIKSVVNGIGLHHDDKSYLNHKVNTFVSSITDDGFDVVEQDGKIVLVGGEKQQHRQFVLEDYAKENLKDFLSAPSDKKSVETVEEKAKTTTLATAKTKSEAYGKIREQVMKKHDINVTHPTWQKRYAEALKENEAILEKLS